MSFCWIWRCFISFVRSQNIGSTLQIAHFFITLPETTLKKLAPNAPNNKLQLPTVDFQGWIRCLGSGSVMVIIGGLEFGDFVGWFLARGKHLRHASVASCVCFGMGSPNLRMGSGDLHTMPLCVSEMIGHPNHSLTIWLDILHINRLAGFLPSTVSTNCGSRLLGFCPSSFRRWFRSMSSAFPSLWWGSAWDLRSEIHHKTHEEEHTFQVGDLVTGWKINLQI